MGEWGFNASHTSAGEPAADGDLGDSEGVGDVALRPALLFQVNGTNPSSLAPIRR